MVKLRRYGTFLIALLFAAWFGHEPSYEPVIGLLLATGGFIAPDIIELTRRWRRPKALEVKNSQVKEIGEIGFDYLPESPTEHNWQLELEGDQKPSFSRPARAPVGNSVEVSATARYRLDFLVAPAEQLTEVVTVSIKLPPGIAGMLYCRLRVSNESHSKSRLVWIGHRLGRGKPVQVNDGEWTVYVDGIPHEDGWITLSLELRKEVAATFGIEGWVLDSLIGFRLRGAICLSPIRLLR